MSGPTLAECVDCCCVKSHVQSIALAPGSSLNWPMELSWVLHAIWCYLVALALGVAFFAEIDNG